MSKIHVKTIRNVERRRRAGMEFGREGIEIDTAKLRKEHLAAIKADPLLEVTNVDDDDAAKKAAAEAAEKEAAEKAAAEAAAAKKSGKK